MTLPMILYILAQVQPNFLPPIESMDDLKGDVIYEDRDSAYFLLIKDDVFYIGHPIGEGGASQEDTSYTWGKMENCSTSRLSCLRAGAQIFIRPNIDRKTTSYADETVLSVWPTRNGEWWGAGVRCAYPSTDRTNVDYFPNITYQYNVNKEGTITRIIISYWRNGKPDSHDLKLETRQGINFDMKLLSK